MTIYDAHINKMNEPLRAATALDDEILTSIDPRYIPVTQIVYFISMLFPLVGAGILEFVGALVPGIFIAPVLLITVFLIFRVPARKYRQWRYNMGADRLRIVSGYLFHSDTIVPFGRIQHIDVEQGPIQRLYGLATLTVHTAGNHNSSVGLPCLAHADALAMRETIRAHIRRNQI